MKNPNGTGGCKGGQSSPKGGELCCSHRYSWLTLRGGEIEGANFYAAKPGASLSLHQPMGGHTGLKERDHSMMAPSRVVVHGDVVMDRDGWKE